MSKRRLWTSADDDVLDLYGAPVGDPGLNYDPFASVFYVECPCCGAGNDVEPDAAYDCGDCGAAGGWVSPLVRDGLM